MKLVSPVRVSRTHMLAIGAVALLLAAAYANRRALVPILRAPYACSLGSGCVDVSPLAAAAVMFGFDLLLVAVAFWQLRWGGFFQAPVGSTAPVRDWRTALLLIGGAALAARLVLPDWRQLRWDEAHIAWLALDGLLQGRLALTGILSSVQIPNPPGAVYLVAPVLALFQDRPGAAHAAITYAGILSAAASLLCAWFTRRWTGSASAGLAAGLAYALAFWPVFLGRRVWQQILLPPFVVLFMDAVLLLAVRRQARALVWGAVWLTVLVQLHYVAVTLLPLLLAAAWLGRRRVGIRYPPLAIGAAGLLLSPFLLWEVAFDTAFIDVKRALEYGEQVARFSLASPQFVLNLSSAGRVEEQIELYALFGKFEPWQVHAYNQGIAELLAHPFRAAGAGTLLLGSGLATVVALIFRPSATATRTVGVFLLAWIVVPVALTLRSTLHLSQHYFFHLLPGIAVLIGIGVTWPDVLGPSRQALLPRLWRGVGLTLLALYLAGSVLVLDVIISLAQRARVDHFDEPVGVLSAAGAAAWEAWHSLDTSQPILVGAQVRDADRMRLAMGGAVPALVFDDCRELVSPPGKAGHAVYFLRDETPSTAFLRRQPDVTLFATIARPGASSYHIFSVPADGFQPQKFSDNVRELWPDCSERYYS